MSTKELARTDQPYSIISLSGKQKSQKQYYLDEIEQLKQTIKGYKKLVNEMMNKKDYLQALEGFRNLFTLPCMIKIGTKITIIQCSNIIKGKDGCKFKESCIDRKKIIEMIT